MAPTLGKRKRQDTKAIQNRKESSVESSESQDVQDIFRRHFEAQFKRLQTATHATSIAKEVIADDDGEESEWEGLSEPEGIIEIILYKQILIFADCEQVEIIEHTGIQTITPMSKDELKVFMVGGLSIINSMIVTKCSKECEATNRYYSHLACFQIFKLNRKGGQG
jgi:hypothetical protein